MANKRNQVKKKSALARRRAGQRNGLKGGYSGYRKLPESSQQDIPHLTTKSFEDHRVGLNDHNSVTGLEDKQSEDLPELKDNISADEGIRNVCMIK